MKRTYIIPQIMVRQNRLREMMLAGSGDSPLKKGMNFSNPTSATSGMTMDANSRDDVSEWSSLDGMFEY